MPSQHGSDKFNKNNKIQSADISAVRQQFSREHWEHLDHFRHHENNIDASDASVHN